MRAVESTRARVTLREGRREASACPKRDLTRQHQVALDSTHQHATYALAEVLEVAHDVGVLTNRSAPVKLEWLRRSAPRIRSVAP